MNTFINYEQFDYLKPLQAKHLEMLQYFNNFCITYNIEWSLAYGSVLGARRHGGPIPWDDDVDIFMTADNYEKFRNYFKDFGNHEKYYLQEKISIEGMVDCPKLRMNNTTFIEESVKDLDMHHGIFMDIFILHKAPKHKFQKLLGKIGGYYIELKIMSNQHYSKRKAYLPLMTFLRLFPKYFGMKTIMKMHYKWDKSNNNEYTVWCIGNIYYPESVLFPFEDIPYENSVLKAPHKVEEFLELTYGNWQNIPKIDNIVWHQHASNWSTTEDFRKTATNIVNFSDEMNSF